MGMLTNERASIYVNSYDVMIMNWVRRSLCYSLVQYI